jgi:hypothetical protein
MPRKLERGNQREIVEGANGWVHSSDLFPVMKTASVA